MRIRLQQVTFQFLDKIVGFWPQHSILQTSFIRPLVRLDVVCVRVIKMYIKVFWVGSTPKPSKTSTGSLILYAFLWLH